LEATPLRYLRGFSNGINSYNEDVGGILSLARCRINPTINPLPAPLWLGVFLLGSGKDKYEVLMIYCLGDNKPLSSAPGIAASLATAGGNSFSY
jgi:hypothetical protein